MLDHGGTEIRFGEEPHVQPGVRPSLFNVWLVLRLDRVHIEVKMLQFRIHSLISPVRKC